MLMADRRRYGAIRFGGGHHGRTKVPITVLLTILKVGNEFGRLLLDVIQITAGFNFFRLL